MPLIEDPSTLVSSLRVLIKDPKELWNQNITKVVVDHFDSALYFSKAPIPWNRDAWSEDRPKTFNSSLWYKHV